MAPEVEQTPALVLRKVDFGESHVILHLLCRDLGRVSAVARGARASKRRFSGCLEPLRVLDATLKPPRKGDLFTAEALDVSEDFRALEDRIERVMAAGYLTELVRETFREGEDAREVFELLRRTYGSLSRASDSAEVQREILSFEMALLSLYGFPLNLRRCARCGASPGDDESLRLSRRGEGLVCGSCRRPGESLGLISAEAFGILLSLSGPSTTTWDSEPLAQAGRVLENALEQVLERPLLTRDLLQQVL